MIKITPNHNNKTVLVELHRSADGIRRGIRRGLFDIGRAHVRNARKSITAGAKTGRVYNIRGTKHQASAPGESPANLSGTLQKSINYTVRGSSEMEFGDKVFYGRFLEDGTTKMKPRQHLGRTVEELRAYTRRTLNRCIDQEIKRRATR